MQSRKPIAKEFKKQVKEILRTIRKHGAYMTEVTIDKILADPDYGIMLLTQLKHERSKSQALQAENDTQKQLIGELQPKADYVDYILSSVGTMTITQIAADYGISAKALNKILKEERIQRKVDDQWILYHEHMNKGYTKSETIPITRSDGCTDTKLFTKWLQKGRLKINEVLNQRGIYANMDLVQAV
jgi:phage antirepressor YoqD-like protein